MKYKTILTVTLCACFSTCLLVFPGGGTEGAINGLKLCSSVIIPSLFPFTVCSLMIFESNIFKGRSNSIKISILSMSLIGGYPVGAKLIEKAFENGSISRKNAQLMLGYCVNSGPSFIIIAVGAGILNSYLLGIILFISSLIGSIVLALILSQFQTREERQYTNLKNKFTTISDMFVSATYDSAQSMISVCAFVVLFSSIIGVINTVLPSGSLNSIIISVLEVTNAISNSNKNIYLISFLLGFSGLSVHFQVLSMCKKVKPNYLFFLILRICHGVVSSVTTKIIVMIFKINVQTIAQNNDFSFMLSEYSVIFSILLLVLSIAFMASFSKSYKTI